MRNVQKRENLDSVACVLKIHEISLVDEVEKDIFVRALALDLLMAATWELPPEVWHRGSQWRTRSACPACSLPHGPVIFSGLPSENGVLRIRDVYPVSQIRIFSSLPCLLTTTRLCYIFRIAFRKCSVADPGCLSRIHGRKDSRIRTKEVKCFNPKICF